jgi:hypothetical protein
MAASDGASTGFWVVCSGRGDLGRPLMVGLPGFGSAVAVFSSIGEEAALPAPKGRGQSRWPAREARLQRATRTLARS